MGIMPIRPIAADRKISAMATKTSTRATKRLVTCEGTNSSSIRFSTAATPALSMEMGTSLIW